ncbi:MAG: hypothetical protein ABSH51_20915 [Solirubrobacteraceae bacterium]
MATDVRVSPAARRPLRVSAEMLAPAVIVALLLGLLVATGLLYYHGDPTGFIRFGRAFASRIHPPRGAVVDTARGYDGQYFWALARDPLLLRDRTVAAFADQGFRLQRVAYPALAYLLAAGRPAAIPWVLLAINVIAVLGITVVVGGYARTRGRSEAWGLAAGLLPGFLFATMGDLSDVLAVSAMLCGLIMWRRRRCWWAAGLLSVAVLAREPMMLAVAGVALEVGARAWQGGRLGAGARALARAAWPACAVPVLAFAAWHAYIQLRYGGSTADPGTAFALPFVAVWREAQRAAHGASIVHGAWDLTYLALMLLGIGASVELLRRGCSAPAIAAVLFSLSLLVLTFGNDWSYTRLSAPLFACLLLGGLERRSRPSLAVCAAAAVLGMLVPLAIA